MKWFLIGIFFVGVNANADVIVSLAAKQSVGTRETTVNNNTTTTKEVTKSSNGTVTNSTSSTTTGSTSDTQYTNKVSYGVLVQGIPSDKLPVAIGVGYFTDNTGMVTLGWRFK